MSNQIVEEVPTQAPAAGGGAQEKLEKQARQLAYDVKYKVKQQMNRGTKLDPAAVKKAYISFLGRATGSPQVKALAKKKLLGEATANQIVAVLREDGDKTFKVRVTDKQTGNTYVRMATRAKIAELRANTNIASVEMTGYGEPTRSSAQATGSKPTAKKDFDGDGKKESSSKEHAGVVHNAIQKKKGGKQDGQDTRSEAFIADAKKEECGDKKVEELKKGKKNIVKVMPSFGEELKKDEKKEEEEDPRSMGTKYRNMKNRWRAMGLKLSHEPEGELTEETPAERIDRISATKVAQRKAKAEAETAARERRTVAFQKHKKETIAQGGRPVDALDSWQKKKLNKEEADPVADAKEKQSTDAIERKQKRADVIKKQVLLKKLQAVRAGGGSAITASHEVEGETIEEADSLAAQTARWEANRQRRMKKSGSYERPNWLPRDQDHSDRYGSSKGEKKKPQKTHANLQNEEVEFELTEEFITERVDHATEYFYKEGINPDGLDLIIEEVGIDEFTAFVIDGPQELNEDEAAYQKAKKKAIAGSDRREREGKGEYSPKGSSSPYTKQGIGAKTKKKPKIGHTGTKVVAATKKAKKAQPAKPTSREGLGSKIRSTVSKGFERHKAAVGKAKTQVKKIAKTASDTAKQHSKHRKDFVGGLKATPKERKIAGGIAKGAKKALTGEEADLRSQKVDKIIEAMSSYDKARKAAARRAADRNAKRRRGEMGGRMERETYTSEGGARMHYKGYRARDGE